MRKLRILLLTPQVPFPPRQGTSLRNYNILKGLCLNNDVTLLTFNDLEEDLDTIPQLKICEQIEWVPMPKRDNRQRIWQLLTNGKPDLSHRLASRAFDEKLRLSLGSGPVNLSYDIVQVEGLELGEYIPSVRQYAPGAKLVFDSHNAEAELQRRAYRADLATIRRWPAVIYSLLQVRRLRKYEATICRSVDAVTAVSQSDAQQLSKLAPGIRMEIIPNCIDVQAYGRERQLQALSRDMVFIGKMDYRPNVDAMTWFVKRIWPRVVQSRPESNLTIVGQKPHVSIKKLAEMDGIEVTGRVNDIKPYLFGAKVVVLPLRVGSGTRLKLIEAMAAGKAIVSTTVGAEGFPVTHGKELLLADDSGSFAKAILELLASSQIRSTLGENATRFASDYDWRRVTPAFDSLYDKLLL